MRQKSQNIAYLFLMVFVLMSGGCRSSSIDIVLDNHNLFSEYAGKTVPLTRDAFVVDSTIPGTNESATYLVSNLPSAHGDTSSTASVNLRAGTLIEVKSTRMRQTRNPHGVVARQVFTIVKVPNAVDPRLSKDILFDCVGGSGGDEYLRFYNGHIRPAPWEPLNTPTVRSIDGNLDNFPKVRD